MTTPTTTTIKAQIRALAFHGQIPAAIELATKHRISRQEIDRALIARTMGIVCRCRQCKPPLDHVQHIR